jgi:hypothetical protein
MHWFQIAPSSKKNNSTIFKEGTAQATPSASFEHVHMIDMDVRAGDKVTMDLTLMVHSGAEPDTDCFSIASLDNLYLEPMPGVTP